ncbi:MAG: Cell division protein FtsL [Pseudomonadota bacterium]|jgi:cell division protein FtsL
MRGFNALNIVCILILVGTCMSLVTSRQQQRLDFSKIESEKLQLRRLQQDFQNLTATQQQLEQTERIERLAREERNMERIPANKTLFLTQSILRNQRHSKPYIKVIKPSKPTVDLRVPVQVQP